MKKKSLFLKNRTIKTKLNFGIDCLQSNNVRQTTKKYGISKSSFYNGYNKLDIHSIENKSKIPKSNPRAIKKI